MATIVTRTVNNIDVRKTDVYSDVYYRTFGKFKEVYTRILIFTESILGGMVRVSRGAYAPRAHSRVRPRRLGGRVVKILSKRVKKKFARARCAFTMGTARTTRAAIVPSAPRPRRPPRAKRRVSFFLRRSPDGFLYFRFSFTQFFSFLTVQRTMPRRRSALMACVMPLYTCVRKVNNQFTGLTVGRFGRAYIVPRRRRRR